MKAKSFFSSISIILLCSFLFSCSSSGHAYKSKRSYGSGEYMGAAGASTTTGTSSLDKKSDWENKNAEYTERKMIYNASLTLTVKKPDTVNAHVVKIAKKYNGYVLTTGYNYTTIRVLADSLQSAMKEISTLGKVKYKSIYGEDITEEYADLDIRLENARKARTRYLELLAKAATVEETLKVEKELERLNTEIDLLEGKINRMNHLEQFSTITVTLQKKVKPGPLGFVFKYLYKGVKVLFVWS